MENRLMVICTLDEWMANGEKVMAENPTARPMISDRRPISHASNSVLYGYFDAGAVTEHTRLHPVHMLPTKVFAEMRKGSLVCPSEIGNENWARFESQGKAEQYLGFTLASMAKFGLLKPDSEVVCDPPSEVIERAA